MFRHQDCRCRGISSPMSVQDLGLWTWSKLWNEIRIWFETAQKTRKLMLTCVLECAYILRFVELNHRSGFRPWSVRQSAIYSRYDSSSNASTWIFVALREPGLKCVDNYLGKTTSQTTSCPFELHVLLLNVAMSNWRAYFLHLSVKIHDLVCQKTKISPIC